VAGLEVIVATYNRPQALHRTLLGLSLQDGIDFSICVADDGSGPATADVVKAWQARLGADRLRHVWHADVGFAKNTIVNVAIDSAKAAYLVFVDGDVIPSRRFVAQHWKSRADRRFVTGGMLRLPQSLDEHITDVLIESAQVFDMQWLRAHGGIGRVGNWLKAGGAPAGLARFLERTVPLKKVWNGANSSGWRKDLLAVNGFDESMVYGAEDVEMGIRLNNAGIHAHLIHYSAPLLHVEHPRPYADAAVIARNKAKCEAVRQTGLTWTAHGIQKSPAASAQTIGGA
jgi:glycosyltransferase involved in cell wall biosynthesis